LLETKLLKKFIHKAIIEGLPIVNYDISRGEKGFSIDNFLHVASKTYALCVRTCMGLNLINSQFILGITEDTKPWALREGRSVKSASQLVEDLQ
jgi:hypothetical protein